VTIKKKEKTVNLNFCHLFRAQEMTLMTESVCVLI